MGVGNTARSRTVWRSLQRQRRVPLTTPVTPDDIERVTDALRRTDGVRHVAWRPREGELIVDYDLVRVTLQEIEGLVEGAGIRLSRSPAQQSLRAAIHRTERNDQRHMRGPGQYCELTW